MSDSLFDQQDAGGGASFSETSVHRHQTTLHYPPEDIALHICTINQHEQSSHKIRAITPARQPADNHVITFLGLNDCQLHDSY
jgi:hypothetical protein